MFLSVAIPVYNAEKFIDNCIESVMNQTMREFELILVNDGSKDHSGDKCRAWQEKYPDQIRVVEKTNTGSLLTRRKCLEESKGDYIYIMDADDRLYDRNAFQIIRTKAEEFRSDLILFAYRNTLNEEKHLPLKEDHLYEDKYEIYRLVLKTRMLNPLWNKVFSRKIVDWETDYSDKAWMSNGTDMYQMLPIISAASRITYIDKVLYEYNTSNDGSILHSFNPLIFRSLKENQIQLQKCSQTWQYPDKELKKEIQIRMMRAASSSAAKLRIDRELGKQERIEFLRSIGEDEMFRKEYTVYALPAIKKIILFLLYHKLFGVLERLFRSDSAIMKILLGNLK